MPPATTATSDAPISADLPCMKCGYNLRTLSPAALCPECGTPVQQSINYVNELSRSSLRLIAIGAGILAVQAAVVPTSEWFRERLEGRMTFDSHFDSNIATVFGMFLSGSMLLAGLTFQFLSRPVPHNRARTLRIYAGLSLAGLYFVVQLCYTLNYFYFSNAPGSWGWGAMVEIFFLHEQGSSRFNPGDGLMRVPWILYATEAAVLGILAFMTRAHLLEFASQTRLPRLASLTRLVFGFLCLMLFLQCAELTSILAFDAGEHTVSPFAWTLSYGLPVDVRQIAFYVCLTIQASYFTTIAIFAWSIDRRFRRIDSRAVSRNAP